MFSNRSAWVMSGLGGASTLFAALTVPALAHHAAPSVIFSADKEVVLTGTVKEFDSSNPHASIWIAVPHNGATVEWRVLTESPNDLEKAGMAPTSLRAGDQVTVRARPAKAGGSSAWLLDVKKADGTLFSIDD